MEERMIRFTGCSYEEALSILNDTKNNSEQDVISAIIKVRSMATDNAVTKKMYQNAVDYLLCELIEDYREEINGKNV